MPVKNFSKPYFDKLEQVSREAIRDGHKTKNHGCTGCFIKCGRYGKFGGKERVSPEYETIAMRDQTLISVICIK
jgi:aldehyde:ferredoxin oxidoreductase